ncbi:hypothetical protein [Rhizobium sp. LEGMi135b]
MPNSEIDSSDPAAIIASKLDDGNTLGIVEPLKKASVAGQPGWTARFYQCRRVVVRRMMAASNGHTFVPLQETNKAD